LHSARRRSQTLDRAHSSYRSNCWAFRPLPIFQTSLATGEVCISFRGEQASYAWFPYAPASPVAGVSIPMLAKLKPIPMCFARWLIIWSSHSCSRPYGPPLLRCPGFYSTGIPIESSRSRKGKRQFALIDLSAMHLGLCYIFGMIRSTCT
jgi:hypothetical protein